MLVGNTSRSTIPTVLENQGENDTENIFQC